MKEFYCAVPSGCVLVNKKSLERILKNYKAFMQCPQDALCSISLENLWKVKISGAVSAECALNSNEFFTHVYLMNQKV